MSAGIEGHQSEEDEYTIRVSPCKAYTRVSFSTSRVLTLHHSRALALHTSRVLALQAIKLIRLQPAAIILNKTLGIFPNEASKHHSRVLALQAVNPVRLQPAVILLNKGEYNYLALALGTIELHPDVKTLNKVSIIP
ncbi:hypothetical protein VP1G_11108 [Cytospora mali]|uniref:Uncharacterized protein n=1 Tax=Cytospora mali TaxID=578113 RepID=A0A194V5H9_CYTMA|nr:hypothetical protein VP1G_11108 [Valsa mali var. pyri (nom. inval.)]